MPAIHVCKRMFVYLRKDIIVQAVPLYVQVGLGLGTAVISEMTEML